MRQDSPSAAPDNHSPLGSGRVQDGTQVIRPHVEVRRAKDTVGKSRTTLVEQDDP